MLIKWKVKHRDEALFNIESFSLNTYFLDLLNNIFIFFLGKQSSKFFYTVLYISIFYINLHILVHKLRLSRKRF